MWQKILYAPFTRLILGVMVILSLMAGIELGFPFLLKPSGLDWRPVLLIQNIGYAVLVPLTYILFYRWYEKREITELTRKGFFRQMGGGLLTGFLFLSVVIGVMGLIGAYRITGFHIGSFLLFSFVANVATGVIEEILLRGIVFRLIEEKLGTWISLVFSAFLFGFLHIWNDDATVFSSIAISLEAGVLLAAAYVYTRNLWYPIFLHAAWNFTCGPVYGAPVSGYPPGESLLSSEIGGPEWLTGGGFGPENAIQTVVLGLVLGGLFIFYAIRKGNFIAPSWKRK